MIDLAKQKKKIISSIIKNNTMTKIEKYANKLILKALKN